MSTLRELAHEACTLFTRASSKNRAGRHLEAGEPTSRAVEVIAQATDEIDRRLQALANLITTPPATRVLCVDDNRDVADSEADLLRIVGFVALACYSGASALSEAPAFRPTLCLIDLNMPGMDGDELAMRLRVQLQPPLRLMAITARDDEASRARIRAAGFDLHLVKPVDPQKLLALVDRR
ncbi:response regulator [Fimbriiglobus ruber]|nr:response regulator [Fimbriiglobus ruber]